MERIFLDNNATTALDPRVFKAMLLDLEGPPANPSSVHWFGQRAKKLLNEARLQTATFFGSKPEEVTFTSGGTESLNFLLRGLKPSGHLITTSIEHSCIFQTLKIVESKGISVTYLPVDLWGAPLPEQVEGAIRSDTQAIILSAANGETGVMIDLEKIADIAHKKKVPLFIDAVAFIGKEPFVWHPGISAVAISGHKFHAPKGIGALISKTSLKLNPLQTGGAQEYQRRSGTENLSGILALAEALKILEKEQIEITQKLSDLRGHLEFALKTQIPDIAINGMGQRISNTSNIAFLGVDGETLLMHLDMAGIAVSHGSACSSGALEPSRVLTNMGIDAKTARSSLRISVGRMNTREEVEKGAEILSTLVKKLRNL